MRPIRRSQPYARVAPDGVLHAEGRARIALRVPGGISRDSLSPLEQARLFGHVGVWAAALGLGYEVCVYVISRPTRPEDVVARITQAWRPPTPGLRALAGVGGRAWAATVGARHIPHLEAYVVIVAPEGAPAVALERAATSVVRFLARIGLGAQRLDAAAFGTLLVDEGLCRGETAPSGTTYAPPELDEHRSAVPLPDGTWAQSVQVLGSPERTVPGSLAPGVALGQPLRLCLRVVAQDREKERKTQETRAGALHGTATMATGGNKVAGFALTGGRDEAAALADALRSHTRGIVGVGLYVTTFAPDRATLERRVADLRDALAVGALARVGDGPGHQAPLWESTLPTGRDAAGVVLKWETEAVGHCWPVLVQSPGMPAGMALGWTAIGAELVLLDLASSTLRGRLIDIFGPIRRGKTVLIQLLIEELLKRGGSATVIDKARGFEVLTALAGGTIVPLGGPGSAALNMWEGPRRTREEYIERVQFVAHAHELLLANPSSPLSDFHRGYLEQGIHEVYRAHGPETAGADVHSGCPHDDTCAPLEREFVAWLNRTADAVPPEDREDRRILRGMAWALKRYVGDGTDANLIDRPTRISLDPREVPLLVFDLAGLDEHSPVRTYAIYAVTRIAEQRAALAKRYSVAEGGGTDVHIVAIDEGWAFLDTDAGRAFVNKLARTAGQLGLIPIFASQQVSDLARSKMAATFFNMAPLHFLFGLEDTDEEGGVSPKDWLGRRLKLTEAELEQIETLEGEEGKTSRVFMVRAARGRQRAAHGVVDLPLSKHQLWAYASDPDPRQRREDTVKAIARDPDAPTALEVWAAVCALAMDTTAADARAILDAALTDAEAWAALSALGTDPSTASSATAMAARPHGTAQGGSAPWAAR